MKVNAATASAISFKEGGLISVLNCLLTPPIAAAIIGCDMLLSELKVPKKNPVVMSKNTMGKLSESCYNKSYRAEKDKVMDMIKAEKNIVGIKETNR